MARGAGLALAACILLLAAGILPAYASSSGEASVEQTVQHAWQLAQESGAHHYRTEIVQTTFPAPQTG